MYASFSQAAPDFNPGIKVNCQTIYSTNSDHKVCLCPVGKEEVIVADRGGKISRVKLLGSTGCSQAELSDNNNGRPVIDVIKAKDDKVYFIDSDRVQLKVSVSKHQAQTVIQNVCSEHACTGKILKAFDKKNQLYVLGNEANTIIVISLDHASIEKEIFVSESKNGRSICSFEVNPANGDVIALTNGGDVVFRGSDAARPDAFYRFDGREGEKFSSNAVDWGKGILVAVGTQTLEKQLHQHIVYVYDCRDTSDVKLVCKSKKWQTKEPEFIDTVGHVFLQEIDGFHYICCFTDATSSFVVFRYSSNNQNIDLVSYPQKLNKGRTADVKQAFGYFFACFDNPDLALVDIHSPSF